MVGWEDKGKELEFGRVANEFLLRTRGDRNDTWLYTGHLLWLQSVYEGCVCGASDQDRILKGKKSVPSDIRSSSVFALSRTFRLGFKETESKCSFR